ncbi:hypothetical protein [Bacteroides sp.]|uniref:hypothetical protein n=1 Tax=Bacteroides sp. TaxID=29523 RepID=UPI002601CE30|nr:hypothetical protein [Bacteroides sp.]MDD3037904.1 hypothetical protein [Bacteroides sp.]
MAETRAAFIGVSALEQIATKYTKQIVMGGVHYRPDVFDRMKILVSTGLQFKDVKTIMNRKGHTTVRKVVGKPVNNTIGYLEERKMVGHLAMNHYLDNKDNYNELAIVDGVDNVNYTYPLSEIAFQAAVANYGEDIFDNLWHGDDTIPDDKTNPKWHLRLYTGFITYLRQDIAMSRISKANKNYVEVETIGKPIDEKDPTPFNIFQNFRMGWSQNLRNAPEVMLYCTEETGEAIADGYGNSKGNNKSVIYNEEAGTFTIPGYRNVTFCPEASFGTGDLMIATVPYNFEYGVDDKDSRTSVSVRVGSDNDHTDISFQVQSIQATRVINVNSDSFCMSNGSLIPNDCAGDYTKDVFVVQSSDTTLGTVTVNDAAPNNEAEYTSGAVLKLVAAPTSTGEFVAWNTGEKTAEITVVTKGQPGARTAIFKKKTT